MEFTDQELTLIETLLSTNLRAVLTHISKLPDDTPESELQPFWEFDHHIGALLEKIRARKKRRKRR